MVKDDTGFESQAPERYIQTEYGSDFPIDSQQRFYGSPYREEYDFVDPKTNKKILLSKPLRDRANELSFILGELISMVKAGLTPPYWQNRAETAKTFERYVSMLVGWERVGLMHNYRKFFDFMYLLLNGYKELYANNKDWTLERALRQIPVLKVILRVTPMGPEPNQVNNMCRTQTDLRTGSSQFDQCTNVYSMCRNKQKAFGEIDQLADLKCSRYIKELVFPERSKQDPDVRELFANYDYARDGAKFLQPYVTNHAWQVEYDRDHLERWVNRYKVKDGEGRDVDYVSSDNWGMRTTGGLEDAIIKNRGPAPAGYYQQVQNWQQQQQEQEYREAKERAAKAALMANFVPSNPTVPSVDMAQLRQQMASFPMLAGGVEGTTGRRGTPRRK